MRLLAVRGAAKGMGAALVGVSFDFADPRTQPKPTGENILARVVIGGVIGGVLDIAGGGLAEASKALSRYSARMHSIDARRLADQAAKRLTRTPETNLNYNPYAAADDWNRITQQERNEIIGNFAGLMADAVLSVEGSFAMTFAEELANKAFE